MNARIIFGAALAAVTLAAPAQAATPQQVIDKTLAAYKAPVQRALDKGEVIKSLGATCTVGLHRTVYDCTFKVKAVKHGRGHTYTFPMFGVVKRGHRATHINRYLDGNVDLGGKHIEWSIAG